jgi:hypothetical protein
MKRKVLIAGAGQLGSRYLQGLAKVAEPLEIWVFDPLEGALTRAEERWKEMQPSAEHAVRYVSSLDALPNSMDIAIVATTADVRAVLVAEIDRHADIRYWVLEKVLTQSVGEIAQLQAALSGGKSAWVNTPMHMWPLYRNIRALCPGGAPIEANFEGFRGLACNSIHYVDFVGRWNGAAVIGVDTSGLQGKWYLGKRDGFYEIDGEILIRFADGSKLRVASERSNLGYKAKLRVGSGEWEVSEAECSARCVDGRTISGGVAFQSQLTAPMVEAIFAGSPCGLPTLAESAQQHTFFLNALLEHWNRYMPNKVERLPIT